MAINPSVHPSVHSSIPPSIRLFTVTVFLFSQGRPRAWGPSQGPGAHPRAWGSSQEHPRSTQTSFMSQDQRLIETSENPKSRPAPVQWHTKAVSSSQLQINFHVFCLSVKLLSGQLGTNWVLTEVNAGGSSEWNLFRAADRQTEGRVTTVVNDTVPQLMKQSDCRSKNQI